MAKSDYSALSNSGRRSKRRLEAGRFALVAYVSLAFILMGTERVLPIVPMTLRSVAADVSYPFLSAFRVPIAAIQGALERLVGVSDLYIESERLRLENQRLKLYRQTVQTLALENEKLRALLKTGVAKDLVLATGRIIGVGGGAFEKSVILNIGSSQGVSRNMAAVADRGLVGRSITVGRFSTRILMITDLNSRVPVRIERSGALAIASGSNRASLSLEFYDENIPVKAGDRVVTSGHGGLFPPGIPVGVVIKKGSGPPLIAPFALLDRLDYIRILTYSTVKPEDDFLPEASTEKIPDTQLNDTRSKGDKLKQTRPNDQNHQLKPLGSSEIVERSQVSVSSGFLRTAKHLYIVWGLPVGCLGYFFGEKLIPVIA